MLLEASTGESLYFQRGPILTFYLATEEDDLPKEVWLEVFKRSDWPSIWKYVK